MEQQEIDLIEQHRGQDAELNTLWEEHLFYEQQLEKLENKPYLTPKEDALIKEVKKKKLTGKTKLQTILDRIRKKEA